MERLISRSQFHNGDELMSKPYLNYFKDKDGNRYKKYYQFKLLPKPLYKVFVIQDRDYDWNFTWEWIFENEQDAQDKVRFIEEEWKEPHLGKYDDVWYSKVFVEKEHV